MRKTDLIRALSFLRRCRKRSCNIRLRRSYRFVVAGPGHNGADGRAAATLSDPVCLSWFDRAEGRESPAHVSECRDECEVPGYEVGGKTGTADKPKPQGGYYDDKVIATFAAVFPANDPKYVLVVTLDEPIEMPVAEPVDPTRLGHDLPEVFAEGSEASLRIGS